MISFNSAAMLMSVSKSMQSYDDYNDPSQTVVAREWRCVTLEHEEF